MIVAGLLSFAVVLLIAFRVRPRPARTTAIVTAESAPRSRKRLPELRPVRARNRQIAQQLPDLIDLVVATVRAGHSPSQAVEQLETVTPYVFATALREVHRQITLGELFAVAIQELPRRLGTLALPLADSLAMADRYGLPLGPVLDRLADEARAQRRRNAEAAARRLPVRLSFPLVCCTLPSFAILSIVPLLAGTISSLRGLNR